MVVKGTSIRNVLSGVEAAFGAEAVARVVSALPERIKRQIEPFVLATSTYPVEVSAALQEAIRTVLGAGSLTANRKVGAAAARIDFSGIYRVFIRVAQYETLLRGLDRAWRQYNSQGTVAWSFIGDGEARGTVRDVEGFNEPMWSSIAGRLETILLLGGASKASVGIETWAPDHVVFVPKWTP